MTKVDAHRSDMSVDPATDLPDQDIAAIGQLQAPYSAVPIDQFASHLAVVRRPPELQFFGTTGGQYAALDAVVAQNVDPLATAGTLDAAYSVADFIVRRESEVSSSGNEAAQDGFEVLTDMARMFEFLFMTSPAAGEQ